MSIRNILGTNTRRAATVPVYKSNDVCATGFCPPIDACLPTAVCKPKCRNNGSLLGLDDEVIILLLLIIVIFCFPFLNNDRC